MKKIAVNIALSVDKETTELAIDLNKELVAKGSKLVLGKESFVPHITLAQGVVYEKDIKEINSLLKEIAENYHSLDQISDELFIGPLSGMFWLKIHKTIELSDFHKEIMNKLKTYFSYDEVNKSMFADPDDVDDRVLNWVKDYPIQSAFDNYEPHISLGFGRINQCIELPLHFKISKLAMYHLGNFGACQKEISSYELTTKK